MRHCISHSRKLDAFCSGLGANDFSDSLGDERIRTLDLRLLADESLKTLELSEGVQTFETLNAPLVIRQNERERTSD